MKRKELEKLTILQATTAMLKQAENEPMIESGYFRKELRYEHEYYARCKRFDRILKVAIYLTKNLAAGGRKPVYELFLDYDAQDFLTYSFVEKKWRTAMLRNLPQQGFGISDAQISSRDSAVIGQYLHSKWCAIAAIREFQEGIREKQLLARHKKETDPWDAAMALLPPLPKDWGQMGQQGRRRAELYVLSIPARRYQNRLLQLLRPRGSDSEAEAQCGCQMPQMQKIGAVQILRQDGPAAHRAKYHVFDAALSGRLCGQRVLGGAFLQ